MYNESEFLIVNFDSHCSLDVLLDIVHLHSRVI